MEQKNVEDSLPYNVVKKLFTEATNVQKCSYSPYSHFRVGAALLCEDDSIVTGTNVENCSYGLTICAERVAICTAVALGHRKFKAMAIVGKSDKEKDDDPTCKKPDDCSKDQVFANDEVVASCGACRQYFVEFGLDWDIYCCSGENSFVKFPVRELIPNAFTPAALDIQA